MLSKYGGNNKSDKIGVLDFGVYWRNQCGKWTIYIEQFRRQDELIYSEGLMDGIRFGYWVALVGRGIGKIEV